MFSFYHQTYYTAHQHHALPHPGEPCYYAFFLHLLLLHIPTLLFKFGVVSILQFPVLFCLVHWPWDGLCSLPLAFLMGPEWGFLGNHCCCFPPILYSLSFLPSVSLMPWVLVILIFPSFSGQYFVLHCKCCVVLHVMLLSTCEGKG